MRTIVFLSLAMFLAGVQSIPGKSAAPFSINLEILKREYILGEPIFFMETWKNETASAVKIGYDPIKEEGSPTIKMRVKGATRKDCLGAQVLAKWSTGYRVLEAGSRIQKELDPARYGVVDEGQYEFWVEYDATDIDEFIFKQGVARIKVESNRVSFRIVKPTGVDALAFEKYGDNACNFITRPSEALDDFPTSIYGAWYLWRHGFSPGYRSPLDALAEKLPNPDQHVSWAVGHPDKLYEFRESAISPNAPGSTYAMLIENLPKAEKVVAALKEGEPRDGIAERLGSIYTSRKDWDKAIKYFKMASRTRERSRQYLAAIAKYLPQYAAEVHRQ